MKFKIIVFIFFLLFVNCVNLVKNKSDEIIIGSVEYNYFVNSTNEWYTEYDHKKFIDFKIVEKIKSYLSEVNIKIFFGTWCEDSRREIPILFEILDEIKTNLNFKIEYHDAARFKKNLDNYNTSELVPSGATEGFDNMCLSSHWISIYRKQ